MTKPRIYNPTVLTEGDKLELDEGNLSYLRNVLRLRKDDVIIIFDGMGSEYEAAIRDFTAGNVVVDIIAKKAVREQNSIHLTLAQSLPKSNKMEFIVQKAVELGIDTVIPFTSSRSIPRLSPEKAAGRAERWRKIALSASMQCGRNILPEITDIHSYNDMLHRPPEGSLKIILWEAEANQGLKDILRDEQYQEATDFFFVVGPEGGFSWEEVEQASKHGFLSAGLGKNVLRVETAALTIISIIQYEKGNLGSC